MTRQDLKKCCRNPVFVCCAVLSLISLVLMFPAVRQMIVSVAENLVVRRPLRDTGKWDRLMLRYASVQLLAIFGFVFVARNKSLLLTNLVRCARGIRVIHVFSGLLILSFIVQNFLFISNPDKTGFYLNNITLGDHYTSVLGGRVLHLGMYPPLAAVIYRLYASMIPSDLFSGNWTSLAYSNAGTYITLLYYLFSVIPFCLLCYAYVDGKRWEKFLVAVSLCFSTPFMFALMRGNIIVLSFCATFFFCQTLRSKSGFVRALGLAVLFVAVGTKLYPVAFAALLVKERRWKELKACFVMVLLMFVFMLTFFDGGMSELSNMMGHITNFTSTFKEHHNLSLKRQVWDILSFFGLAKDTGLFPVLSMIVYLLYIVTSGVLFLLTKKRWVELMLLALACLFLPGVVRVYAEIFLIIPIVEMFNCKDKDLILYVSIAFILLMMLFLHGLAYFITDHTFLVTFPLFALCSAEVVRERRNPMRIVK
ncbi:MAG: DUF2029 domain-containing protein [Treponema sp.]|nr:DUF2029 domain-containing protein [Treponema sp.]